jgi:hypothetical protein
MYAVGQIRFQCGWMEMRYKQVETAVAASLDVKPSKMAALRARILYLRKLGLPKLPKVGSGAQIDYSERNALEILIALLLERGGQTPKNAAQFAVNHLAALPIFGPDNDLRLDEYEAQLKAREVYPGDMRFAVTLTDAPTMMRIEGDNRPGVISMIEARFKEERPGRRQLVEPPPFLVVNLSAWTRRLKVELERAIDD